MFGSLSRLEKQSRQHILIPPKRHQPDIMASIPLNAGKNSRHVVCRTPAVLENVETEFAGGVNIRVEHLADELDRRRLVGILLLKVHYEAEGAIFERCIGGTDDNGIPVWKLMLVIALPEVDRP